MRKRTYSGNHSEFSSEEVVASLERIRKTAQRRGRTTWEQIDIEANSGNRIARHIRQLLLEQKDISQASHKQEMPKTEKSGESIVAPLIGLGILGGLAAIVGAIFKYSADHYEPNNAYRPSGKAINAVNEVENLLKRAQEAGRKPIAQAALESLGGNDSAQKAIETLRNERENLPPNILRGRVQPRNAVFDQSAYDFFRYRRGSFDGNTYYLNEKYRRTFGRFG